MLSILANLDVIQDVAIKRERIYKAAYKVAKSYPI